MVRFLACEGLERQVAPLVRWEDGAVILAHTPTGRQSHSTKVCDAATTRIRGLSLCESFLTRGVPCTSSIQEGTYGKWASCKGGMHVQTARVPPGTGSRLTPPESPYAYVTSHKAFPEVQAFINALDLLTQEKPMELIIESITASMVLQYSCHHRLTSSALRLRAARVSGGATSGLGECGGPCASWTHSSSL